MLPVPPSSPAAAKDMWVVEKIEISGGFLPGLSINVPQGLTCIIGARGSGKSTLAEAMRFALCGIAGAPKPCVDLIQANLAGGALVTITALADGSNRYTIKRGLKQNPVLLASDGRAINTVDLDRGTFLPVDAYSSLEIEAIADEVLGDKRRNLLDELRSEQMRTIHFPWPRAHARWTRMRIVSGRRNERSRT